MLRSLWHYHADMLAFHTGLASDHPYEAKPWAWLFQSRPTSFFYESPKRGEHGCAVDTCSEAITSVGNPLIWWAGALSLVVLLVCWLLRRDWRAGALLGAFAAGWLPWFLYPERTIYSFYAVAFEPFLVLGLAYVLGLVLGPRDAPPSRRVTGALRGGRVRRGGRPGVGVLLAGVDRRDDPVPAVADADVAAELGVAHGANG